MNKYAKEFGLNVRVETYSGLPGGLFIYGDARGQEAGEYSRRLDGETKACRLIYRQAREHLDLLVMTQKEANA